MISLQPVLDSLLKSLPSPPVTQDALDSLVTDALQKATSKSSAENSKAQWEYLLKNEIFELAVRAIDLASNNVKPMKHKVAEGKALQDCNTTYYYDLTLRLDLVLAFTEHGRSGSINH